MTTAPEAAVASAVMSAWVSTAGAVVSRTVTLKVLVPVLWWASVAEQVTVVLPSGKVEPEAGAHVTASVPSTASVAVGAV